MPSSEKISQLSSISGGSINATRDFVPIVRWNLTENTGSNFRVDVDQVINTCNDLPEITSGFLNSTNFITVAKSTDTYKLSLFNLSRTSSYTRTSSLSVSSSHAIKVNSSTNATTASFSTTAVSSNTTTSSSYATRSRSSSYTTKAGSSDTTTSSSYATRSRSSSYVSYAVSAATATSASYATQARSASYATTAKSASYATNATTATTSTTAISASYAANGGGSGTFGLTANTTVNFNSSMTTAQMQALIDAQPRMLNQYILTFQFADGTYSLTAPLYFKYFVGNLQILGNASNFSAGTSKNVILTAPSGQTSGALNIYHCSHPTVKGIRVNISGTGSPRGIVVYFTICATFWYNYISRSDNGTAAGTGTLFESWYSGFTDAYANYFNAGYVAISSLGSTIGSNTNTSSPNSSTYSLNADSGIIFRTGTQPSGTILAQNAGATYT